MVNCFSSWELILVIYIFFLLGFLYPHSEIVSLYLRGLFFPRFAYVVWIFVDGDIIEFSLYSSNSCGTIYPFSIGNESALDTSCSVLSVDSSLVVSKDRQQSVGHREWRLVNFVWACNSFC